MMTVKDWKFVFRMMELIAQQAHQQGLEDAHSKTARNKAYFSVKGPMELIFKKKYDEFINSS